MVSLDNTAKQGKDETGSDKIEKNIYIIAQEIKIARSLACNDPKEREKQLRKLRKWLKIRSNSLFEFSNEDFLRLWKGLYYCMWMSDKSLVQETLAEDLGQLVECFSNIQMSINFFDAFLKTMCLEWFGIDQWRIDKFLMLIRRMLRYMLKAIKKTSWSKESIKFFSTIIYSTVLESKVVGFIMHFLDIFLDELAKISEGNISGKTVTEFMMPFVKYMAIEKDAKLLAHVKNKVFYHLMWQSERGREYTEKYNAWKHVGFSTSSIHDLEKIENESDNEAENEIKLSHSETFNHLDPRGGNVDVFMPILIVDPQPIIKYIKNIMYKDQTNTRSRKILNEVLKKYEIYETGDFPLGIKSMPKLNLEPSASLFERKLSALDELDNELFRVTRDIKKLNKKKRRKFLCSINYDEANEENFENMVKRALYKNVIPTKQKKRKFSIHNDWKEEEIVKIPKIDDYGNTKANKKNDLSLSNKNIIQENNLGNFKPVGNEPLKDSEVEANRSFENEETGNIRLLINPYAKKIKENVGLRKNILMGKSLKKKKSKIVNINNPVTPKEKKVKIVLDRNMAQKPSEYIRQVKNSPQLPYDSERKPMKSLLKPNSVPSPINPFYKKKINLQL